MVIRNRGHPNGRNAKLDVSGKFKRSIQLFKKIGGKPMGTNETRKKMDWAMKLLIIGWIMAATLGGCVVSLNIQKNNNNSDQKVEQNASANQENDSTLFNIETLK